MIHLEYSEFERGITVRYNNFNEFEKHYSKYFSQKKYQEALDLLEGAYDTLSKEEYEENIYTILFDKAHICIMLGKNDECLNALECLNNKGFVSPLHWNRFNPLHKNVRFFKLKRKNAILRAKAQEKAKLKYEIYLPEGYSENKKYPVFFNLHGDGDDIKEHKKYWKPDMLLQKGFIVVYPQSSQVLYYNGYAWCKRLFNAERMEECTGPNELYDGKISRGCYDLSHYEIKSCYEEIAYKYSIDEECILIGGMSGGATATLEFTMSNTIPIKGFIALCPELKPSSFTKDSVSNALNRGVRGVFMEGEHARIVDDEEKMMKVFDDVGFPYESYINKGIGHWYPDDLDEKVESALKFILGNE